MSEPKTTTAEDLSNVLIPLGGHSYICSPAAHKRIMARIPSVKRVESKIGSLYGIDILIGTPEELAEADRQLQQRRKKAGLPPEGRYDDVRSPETLPNEKTIKLAKDSDVNHAH